MKQFNDAEVDERIRALPAPSPPAALAARVHARALAALEEGGARGRAARVVTGFAVVSACAIYLAWALRFLSALAQG
jgi:hypothetical protein